MPTLSWTACVVHVIGDNAIMAAVTGVSAVRHRRRPPITRILTSLDCSLHDSKYRLYGIWW